MILKRMVQNSKRIFITGIKGQLGSTLDKYLSSYFYNKNCHREGMEIKKIKRTIAIGARSKVSISKPISEDTFTFFLIKPYLSLIHI